MDLESPNLRGLQGPPLVHMLEWVTSISYINPLSLYCYQNADADACSVGNGDQFCQALTDLTPTIKNCMETTRFQR
jgi:hypothetical protein